MKSLKACAQTVWTLSRPVRWRVAITLATGLVRIAVSLSFVWASKHLVDIATGVSTDSLGRGIGLFLHPGRPAGHHRFHQLVEQL